MSSSVDSLTGCEKQDPYTLKDTTAQEYTESMLSALGLTDSAFSKTPKRFTELLFMYANTNADAEKKLEQSAQNAPDIAPSPTNAQEKAPAYTNTSFILRDEPFCSMCPHYLMPFFGKITIAHCTHRRVSAPSAIKRYIRALSCAFTLQEILGQNLCDGISRAFGADCVVHIVAQHACDFALTGRAPSIVETYARSEGQCSNSYCVDSLFQLINRHG